MKILFICTHNACRSVLGEVISRELSQGKIISASAGSNPRGVVHPLTLQYLAKHGYPTDNLTSQSWDDFEDLNPDVVITACDNAAGEACPVWFGDTLKVHWGLPDPTKNIKNNTENGADEENVAKAFAHVIGTLEKRINTLLEAPYHEMDKEQLGVLFNQLAEVY